MLEIMDLRFPTGPYVAPDTITPEQRTAWIDEIARTPAAMRAAVAGLSQAQLDTPYREGGWAVRQVVHHVPDSHIHAYVRMKSALTEEHPLVRAYDEQKYAVLPDYRDTPVEVSLVLLEALHARWIVLMRSLTEADFSRVYVHSENGPTRLDQQIAHYAWHCRHHVAHITTLRDRMGWK
jgi:hypothetical protein